MSETTNGWNTNGAMAFCLDVARLLLTILLSISESLLWAIVPDRYLLTLFPNDVAGRVVLITGAGSGIGRALAYRFAARNSTLVLYDVVENALRETADEIKRRASKSSGRGGAVPPVHTYVCDISNAKQVEAIAEQVHADVGSVDILVNNAGITNGKSFCQTEPAALERLIRINVLGQMLVTRSLLPRMLESQRTSAGKQIVNISSLSGVFGTSGLVDYSASKFAIVGFNEALEGELDHSHPNANVRLTLVCPYFICTGLFAGVNSRLDWLLGMIDVEDAVDAIFTAVLLKKRTVFIPSWTYIIAILKWSLPYRASKAAMTFFGGHKSMDTFVGRKRR